MRTKNGIEGHGLTQYALKSFPGVGHTISLEILNDVMDVLAALLPHDPAFAVKPKDPSEMTVKELMKAIKASGLGAKAVGLSEKHEFVQLLVEHRSKS